jgi:hypothetical protein
LSLGWNGIHSSGNDTDCPCYYNSSVRQTIFVYSIYSWKEEEEEGIEVKEESWERNNPQIHKFIYQRCLPLPPPNLPDATSYVTCTSFEITSPYRAKTHSAEINALQRTESPS